MQAMPRPKRHDHCRRAGPDAASGLDRCTRPCDRTSDSTRSAARSSPAQLARPTCNSGCGLRRCTSRRELDPRPRLESGAVARQEVPDRRRPRRRCARPSRGAGARRRPCARRQQRRDEGCRRHRRYSGARRRRIENGLFVDNAQDLIDKAVPAADDAEVDQALAKAQDILLGYGVTGVGSMSTTVADWHAMRRAGDGGRLQVRLMVYADELKLLQRSAASDAVALWRPAAHGRHQILRRRRARLARRLAEAALFRQAGLARAAIPFRCGDAARWPKPPRRMDSRSPRHAIGDAANAQIICAYEKLSRKYRRRTGAGGSSISRSSIRQTSRASPRPGSSPRCSRPIRPAIG